MDTYLTSDQVAKRLQLHPNTIRVYLRRGDLPAVKVGKGYRIKESDVVKFMEPKPKIGVAS